MLRSLLRPAASATCLAGLTVLAGCHTPDQNPDGGPLPPTSNAPEPSIAPEADSGLFPDAMPEADRNSNEPCPYLDTQFVAEANGQKVTGQGVDTRFDTPACVFWSYSDEPQLQVIVRSTSSESEARAVVDWATPVASTDPADQPEGWAGGRAGDGAVPGRSGAAYAVSKGTTAVVVFSDQAESVKAEAVAVEAIKNLGL